MSFLINFIEDVYLITLTDSVVEQTISIRKLHKIKRPDAVIATTALENDLVLLTRNVYDFKDVDGLAVTNPHLV